MCSDSKGQALQIPPQTIPSALPSVTSHQISLDKSICGKNLARHPRTVRPHYAKSLVQPRNPPRKSTENGIFMDEYNKGTQGIKLRIRIQNSRRNGFGGSESNGT